MKLESKIGVQILWYHARGNFENLTLEFSKNAHKYGEKSILHASIEFKRKMDETEI